jgi:hypothetical protein
VDVDQNWFGRSVLGITVGTAYMSLANINETDSVWSAFMRIPEIQTALARARTTANADASDITR